ncbi:hypothetical protein AAG906_019565 [Vitis piasezkii]
MGDGWIDNRQRTLINFLIYSIEGISFVKSVDASNIVKDATNLLISHKHKHINLSSCATYCLNLIFKDIGKMDNVTELVRHASRNTIFVKREEWTKILRLSATCFATTFIVLKSLHDHKHDLQALVTSKLDTMNEMKLFRDRLGSFGRDLTYSSREVLQPVDEDELVKLDVEELENLLYEKKSIPINEVEDSSSHIDDKDGGGVAVERLDVENFGFPNAHFESPYPNFQNE